MKIGEEQNGKIRIFFNVIVYQNIFIKFSHLNIQCTYIHIFIICVNNISLNYVLFQFFMQYYYSIENKQLRSTYSVVLIR